MSNTNSESSTKIPEYESTLVLLRKLASIVYPIDENSGLSFQFAMTKDIWTAHCDDSYSDDDSDGSDGKKYGMYYECRCGKHKNFSKWDTYSPPCFETFLSLYPEDGVFISKQLENWGGSVEIKLSWPGIVSFGSYLEDGGGHRNTYMETNILAEMKWPIELQPMTTYWQKLINDSNSSECASTRRYSPDVLQKVVAFAEEMKSNENTHENDPSVNKKRKLEQFEAEQSNETKTSDENE